MCIRDSRKGCGGPAGSDEGKITRINHLTGCHNNSALISQRHRRQKEVPQRGTPACRKTSLCETGSADTGEVALAPEGDRCPEGAEVENLALARNISFQHLLSGSQYAQSVHSDIH